mgnify:CR=1 FL=1
MKKTTLEWREHIIYDIERDHLAGTILDIVDNRDGHTDIIIEEELDGTFSVSTKFLMGSY